MSKKKTNSNHSNNKKKNYEEKIDKDFKEISNNDEEKLDKEISNDKIMDNNVKNDIESDDVDISNTDIGLFNKNELVELDKRYRKEDNKMIATKIKPKKHIFLNMFLIVLLLSSLVFFAINISNKNIPLTSLISNLLLTLFSILFVVISFTYNKKKKGIIFLGSLLLFAVFICGIINNYVSVTPTLGIKDFRGKDLTYVVKWASKNNVKLNQEYEYSDMVSEYEIISQKVVCDDSGKITELTVSISEGPNPSKEIIVPSMISWDSERVLNFVRDNYLSNVLVEFVESDKAKDTVIEQNASGNLKRDEELKLTFSYGEELDFDEVTLIDFTGKSKFEVEFYMKQNQLRYEFNDEFSKDTKKGYAFEQSILAGEVVKVDDKKIKVTISKGPKIKVPDLSKYSVTEITEWAIKNKLKLNFTDKYDDSIKVNGVISYNYSTGDIIEQGTVVKVVLSRGSLKMPKFKSLSDFYTWANKYEIKYEEKHEFSDSIEAGEVISYSYKNGDTIKNNDTIVITISDGKKRVVPNLKGLSKSDAISKLEKVGLKYNFIYRNSSEKKDIVLNQSISSGSEVSNGITITVTLSNGKKEESSNKDNSDNKSNSNSNSDNNKSDNDKSNSNNSSSNEDKKEENTCKDVKVYIYDELISNNPNTTCSKIQSAYKSLKFSCSYVCGPTNGLLLNSAEIDDKSFSTCNTINLRIASSDKC